MTHREKATTAFLSGYNCAQAVLLAYAPDCSLTEETALKLSSSFGGGMGKLREVCGTVSAMLMVAGVLAGYSEPHDKEKKDAHYALVQSLAKEFEVRFGSYLCRDLLGVVGKQEPVSEERTPAYYRVRPCIRFVVAACEILDARFFPETEKKSAEAGSEAEPNTAPEAVEIQ